MVMMRRGSAPSGTGEGDVLTQLRAIWHPDMYHGHGKDRGFFEGWYFKVADRRQERLYAFIPGVFLGEQRDTSHSFVQVLDGRTGRTTYHRYPLSDFQASRSDFDVTVGPNRFRADCVSLDLSGSGHKISGELRFAGVKPWPVTAISPGIMGWYAIVPFMECYHGVVSLDHAVEGRLRMDGEEVSFDGGRGYTEKDWGQAFPRAWVWMQTNHFGPPGTSLTASVATIPWLSGAFRGFIAGLLHGGRLYRFATYTRAAVEELALGDTHVTLQLAGLTQGGRHRLRLEARRAGGGLLHGPERVAMLKRVAESLTSQVHVRLTAVDQTGERVVFEGDGRHAGLEVNGALEDILDNAKTRA